MLVEFRLQAAFDHGFGQFFEQATFSQDVLGMFIIFEQFIDQFAPNSHAGSPFFLVLTFVRSDRLHKLLYSLAKVSRALIVVSRRIPNVSATCLWSTMLCSRFILKSTSFFRVRSHGCKSQDAEGERCIPLGALAG